MIINAFSARNAVATLSALLATLLFVSAGVAQQSVVAEVPANIAPHAAPTQPLPFSHKTHVTLGLDCLGCHSNPDPGALMTYPATEFCVACHTGIAIEKPGIVSLSEFAESGQEIPWVRVYAITPGVTWSHRKHLDSGTQCDTCHGDVSETEAIAETKATLAMATCISCHEAQSAKTECVTCHAWPTDQLLGIE